MLCRHPLVALAVVVSMTLAGSALAGGGAEVTGWVPCGQQIQAVVVSPTTPSPTLLAATPREIFSSTDSGRTWLQASAPEYFLVTLAVSPAAPSTVYAGTTRGVLRSTDAGRSFVPANEGLTNLGVLGITPDPTSPATVYAGTNGGGICKSKDSGGTWASSGMGLPEPSSVNNIVVDPSKPRVLYAGLQLGGVFRSTDSGASWTAASTVVPSGTLTHLAILSLVIDPASPATLYAGTGDGAVYRTTNGGSSWAASSRGLETHATENGRAVIFSIMSLVVDPRAPSTLHAGTLGGGNFRSSDSGRTWAHRGTGSTRNISLAIDPTNPSTMYSRTTKGISRSTDSGETWGSVCGE